MVCRAPARIAIAPKPLVERLRAALGPWPVSGAAIAIGSKALMDEAGSRRRECGCEARIGSRRTLGAAGLTFRRQRALPAGAAQDAQGWYERLAESGILCGASRRVQTGCASALLAQRNMVRLCKALVLEPNVRPAGSVLV